MHSAVPATFFGKSSLTSSLLRVACAALFALVSLMTLPAQAQVTAFKQAVAEAASDDRDLAAFYRERNFEGMWTDETDGMARRKALLSAMQSVTHHGLPAARHDTAALMALLRDASSPRDAGFAEVALSKAFLALADDLKTGLLDPARTVSQNKRPKPTYDRTQTLRAFATNPEPRRALRALAPTSSEYTRLMKESIRLSRLAANGG